MSDRKTGTVKWFDRRKGYGFIETEGSPDMFVHQSEIQVDGFRALYPDQQVEFEPESSGPKGRLCATKVTSAGGSTLEAAKGRTRRAPRAPRTDEPRGEPKPKGEGRTEVKREVKERQPKAVGDEVEKPKSRTRSRPRNRTRTKRQRRPRLSNLAFVFIKPHALTDRVKDLVRTTLESHGIKITDEGRLTAEEIDSKKLIDQHYYAIASKATILKPDQLNIPKDKFKEQFGEEWDAAMAAGKVFNAMDACKELGIDAEKMNDLWVECKSKKRLVKLGGGFYCGLVEHEGKTLYSFNGFFMSMRSKFTTPGTAIHYFLVDFAPSKLAWADFRGKVLGPTDPADAPADSLRGLILAQWKELGLAECPNTGDNGVHASASPFEALAERMNWLARPTADDGYGQALLAAGFPQETINEWTVDPQVKLADGTTGSLFDALEDLDARDCLFKCCDILGLKRPEPKKAPVQAVADKS